MKRYRFTTALLLLPLLLFTPPSAAAQESGEAGARPTVALVLAGGGALGFAHVGVIRALEEAGVEPDIVVGNSMGSIVGGLYAAGFDAGELTDLIRSTDWNAVLFDSFDRRRLTYAQRLIRSSYPLTLPLHERRETTDAGASQAQHVVELLDSLLENYPAELDFDALPRRYRAVATDLLNGERVVFDNGDLKSVMRASMAVPGIFTPVYYRGRYLIDGGWVDNTPAHVAADMGADIIITVPLETLRSSPQELDSIAAVSQQAVEFLKVDRFGSDREVSDLIIAPDLKGYTYTDFTRGAELITAGYTAAVPLMPELRALALRQGARRPSPPAPAPREITISAVRLIADTENERTAELRKMLEEKTAPVTTVPRIRALFEGLYDTGEYDRAWYRLIPLPGGEYILEADLDPRELPGGYLAFGADFAGLPVENMAGYGTLNAAWARLIGEERRTAFAVQTSISEVSSARISMLAFPTSDLFLDFSLYADQTPRFYYDELRLAALYAYSRFGLSGALGLPLTPAVSLELAPRIEHRYLSRRYGENLFEQEGWNRYGGEIAVILDTLDSAVIPSRGLFLTLAGEADLWTPEDLTAAVRTEGEIYIETGPKSVLSPRIEGELLITGERKEAERSHPGEAVPPHGYYPQEISADSYLLGALRFRRRLADFPPGIGNGLYLQLAGNSFITRSAGTASDDWHHGASLGLVAETAVGEITLLGGVNADGRPVSFLGLRSTIPGALGE